MNVWNWKIGVGNFEIFLEACDTMARSFTIQLLRYLLLHDAEQYSIHNPPPHSLDSQRPTATRGTGFLLEQLVAESTNQYASTTARGQLACICNLTMTTKIQSLQLIDLHARRWRSWRRETRERERESWRMAAEEGCGNRMSSEEGAEVPRTRRRTLREGDELSK
jgi:hypothetical protein